MSQLKAVGAEPSGLRLEIRCSTEGLLSSETYRAEESIGWMMRRIMAAVSQAVERAHERPGPTYPQWMPLHKLSLGLGATVAELAREMQSSTRRHDPPAGPAGGQGPVSARALVADRRVVNIELTDEGRAAVEEVPRSCARCRTSIWPASATRSGSNSRATCDVFWTTARPCRPVRKR